MDLIWLWALPLTFPWPWPWPWPWSWPWPWPWPWPWSRSRSRSSIQYYISITDRLLISWWFPAKLLVISQLSVWSLMEMLCVYSCCVVYGTSPRDEWCGTAQLLEWRSIYIVFLSTASCIMHRKHFPLQPFHRWISEQLSLYDYGLYYSYWAIVLHGCALEGNNYPCKSDHPQTVTLHSTLRQSACSGFLVLYCLYMWRIKCRVDYICLCVMINSCNQV